MPKVNKDNELFEKVVAIIRSVGSVSEAARRLGVNKATLWRFSKGGRAIGRTRAALVQALALIESETARPSEPHRSQERGIEGFPVEDLRGMRELCNRMVAWIDMAEKASANARARGFGDQVAGSIGQHGGQHGR